MPTVHGAGDGGTLRRRREAALRMAPHGGGPTDPLDGLAGLPIRHRPQCCPGEFTAAGWRPHCKGVA